MLFREFVNEVKGITGYTNEALAMLWDVNMKTLEKWIYKHNIPNVHKYIRIKNHTLDSRSLDPKIRYDVLKLINKYESAE